MKNIKKILEVTKKNLKGLLKNYISLIKSGEVDKAKQINDMILYFRQVEGYLDNIYNGNLTLQNSKHKKYNKETIKPKKFKKLRKLKVKSRWSRTKPNKNSAKKVKEKLINSKQVSKPKTKRKETRMVKDLEDKIIPSKSEEHISILKWDSYRLNDISEFINDKPPEERIGFIAGFKDDGQNSFIPGKIFDLDLAVTTPVGATPKSESISNILNYLNETGHVLNGIVHRHYGNGPSATYPSSVDLVTLQNLQLYSPVVSIIFSEDNYFRFVSGKMKIENRIYGNGIKKVGDNNEKVYCFC
jgi:hypothetical protein